MENDGRVDFYDDFWMKVKMCKSSYFSQGTLSIQGMCGACGTEEQLWTSMLLGKARQCHLPCPQVLLHCSASVAVFSLKVISVFPDKQQGSSRKSLYIF